MTVQTRCARCRRDYEASYREVLAGPEWKFCPDCRNSKQDEPPTETQCGVCDRVLRANGRTICRQCLGLGVA